MIVCFSDQLQITDPEFLSSHLFYYLISNITLSVFFSFDGMKYFRSISLEQPMDQLNLTGAYIMCLTEKCKHHKRTSCNHLFCLLVLRELYSRFLVGREVIMQRPEKTITMPIK